MKQQNATVVRQVGRQVGRPPVKPQQSWDNRFPIEACARMSFRRAKVTLGAAASSGALYVALSSNFSSRLTYHDSERIPAVARAASSSRARRRPPVHLTREEIDRVSHEPDGFSRINHMFTTLNLWALGGFSKFWANCLARTRITGDLAFFQQFMEARKAARISDASSPTQSDSSSDLEAGFELSRLSKSFEEQGDIPNALQHALRARLRLLAVVRDAKLAFSSAGAMRAQSEAQRLGIKAEELRLVLHRKDKYSDMREGAAGDFLWRAAEELAAEVARLETKEHPELCKLVRDSSGRRRGLVTVENHVSTVDDPVTTSAIVPWGILRYAEDLRWTFGATDHCFASKPRTVFFRHVKVLPIERGGGIDQYSLEVGTKKLGRGDWIHFYPTGGRSPRLTQALPDGTPWSDDATLPWHSRAYQYNSIGRVRKGVCKLICESSVTPVVVPVVHCGMEGLIPIGAILPRPGQNIGIIVGEPLDFSELLAQATAESWTKEELYARVSTIIESALVDLRERLWHHLEESEQE